MTQRFLSHLCTFIFFLIATVPAAAQNAFPGAPTIYGRLFSPANSSGASRPLALEIKLPPGWHTYWRNPGASGAPPQLNWSQSTNFKSAEILWPAPKRFIFEGLQTFGYDGTFILPLTVTLENSDEPAQLKLAADLVVCTDICVPAHFDATLGLPAAKASPDDVKAWGEAMSRLPMPYTDAGITIDALALTAGNHLRLAATSRIGWQQPDLIVEAIDDIGFGKPEIDVDDNKAVFTLKLDNAPDAKKLAGSTVKLTFVDQKISADGDAQIAVATSPAAPQSTSFSLAYLLAIALLGGLILNLMPCVLPVLSLKLLSVVQHAGETRRQIRRGFLATSLGILTSFWLIASALLIVKQSGMALGWGIQFQHPLFLTFLLAVVLAFAANLWGWFEINTPQKLQQKVGGPLLDSQVPSARHEFLTGMLATLLATPCTAPFVGTSVGFALAGSASDIFAIFTALGLGLALPYLLIAAFPALAQRLPRPGRWMLMLRLALGFTLLATALWLLSILYLQLGKSAIITMTAASLILLVTLWKRWFWAAFLVGFTLTFAPLALQREVVAESVQNDKLKWQAFEPDRIPALVAEGKTVLVDITAQWCITCHANEKFVISTDSVQQALSAPNIYLMRGDWTQPDDKIAQFLMHYKRAGIPFNMIVGTCAPEGIILSELLTRDAIRDALEKAGNK